MADRLLKAVAKLLAGQTLEKAATSPAGARDALANQPPDLVPGSQPTTAQVAGDVGLHSLEREVQTEHPAEFAERRGEQNKARVEAIQKLQPDGSPVEVANAVKASLADIDAMTESAVGRATQEAQGARERLGGTGAPEQYGAVLRTSAQNAENAARRREGRIWEAIDPDRTTDCSGQSSQGCQ